ncbi:hypothetical protein Pfo_013233, partial [Paulownia fortunei]
HLISKRGTQESCPDLKLATKMNTLRLQLHFYHANLSNPAINVPPIIPQSAYDMLVNKGIDVSTVILAKCSREHTFQSPFIFFLCKFRIQPMLQISSTNGKGEQKTNICINILLWAARGMIGGT